MGKIKYLNDKVLTVYRVGHLEECVRVSFCLQFFYTAGDTEASICSVHTDTVESAAVIVQREQEPDPQMLTWVSVLRLILFIRTKVWWPCCHIWLHSKAVLVSYSVMQAWCYRQKGEYFLICHFMKLLFDSIPISVFAFPAARPAYHKNCKTEDDYVVQV